jgi:predicted nucleotidyltransferase
MNRARALETLKRSEPALRARGVRHAAVFGSVARGDNRPDSDVDIMVEIDPEAHITVFDYAGLKEYIASLFAAVRYCTVGVGDRHGGPHLA